MQTGMSSLFSPAYPCCCHQMTKKELEQENAELKAQLKELAHWNAVYEDNYERCYETLQERTDKLKWLQQDYADMEFLYKDVLAMFRQREVEQRAQGLCVWCGRAAKVLKNGKFSKYCEKNYDACSQAYKRLQRKLKQSK